MAVLTVDFRKHSGPTPADYMAAQIITDCANLTLDFKQQGFCASPLFLQTLGPWFPNEMQNLLSSEKMTLDHWSTAQLFFSLAQVICFSSLLVKLSQVFESALLNSILKLAVIPVACAHFLTQFLPVNFAFNMLWHSTPWTATPFSNDPLWLTLFVEGVNDRLLDYCQVSSVPHYCGFKEQEIPRMYTVWLVIYWNSNVNILIFLDTDFWLSLAVSSNHQN